MLGKSLAAAGMLPQISKGPDNTLMALAIAGYILDAVGGALGHLFAADASELKKQIRQTNARTDAKIEESKK